MSVRARLLAAGVAGVVGAARFDDDATAGEAAAADDIVVWSEVEVCGGEEGIIGGVCS